MKKRLITGDEFPPVAWVRIPGFNGWFLICGIDTDNGLLVGTSYYPIDYLATAEAVWSPDRKEIRSFWVEEAA